jgi:hypothetical protein
MPRYEVTYAVTQEYEVSRYVKAKSEGEAMDICRSSSPFEGEHDEHEGTRTTLDWEVRSVQEEDE